MVVLAVNIRNHFEKLRVVDGGRSVPGPQYKVPFLTATAAISSDIDSTARQILGASTNPIPDSDNSDDDAFGLGLDIDDDDEAGTAPKIFCRHHMPEEEHEADEVDLDGTSWVRGRLGSSPRKLDWGVAQACFKDTLSEDCCIEATLLDEPPLEFDGTVVILFMMLDGTCNRT